MKSSSIIIFSMLSMNLLSSCCKHKTSDCYNSQIPTTPFYEYFQKFYCNNNVEYEYVFRKKEQIDSLLPECFIASGNTSFPVDQNNMIIFAIGKLSQYHRDTFQTNFFKDTCGKKLTFNINMIQRDTIPWQAPGAVVSMFSIVENIPADYQVEVKYKYVPK